MKTDRLGFFTDPWTRAYATHSEWYTEDEINNMNLGELAELESQI